jgi:hypothetical protein
VIVKGGMMDWGTMGKALPNEYLLNLDHHQTINDIPTSETKNIPSLQEDIEFSCFG